MRNRKLSYTLFLIFIIAQASCKSTMKKTRYDPLSPELKKKKYNIILITFDALGARYLSLYGFPGETAPNIRKFSRHSYIFTNAVSQSGSTISSLSSIFTSRYYDIDDVLYKGGRYLKKNRIYLPYVLSENGYENYGIVSDYLSGSVSGFEFGFDVFNDVGHDQRRRASETFAMAAELMEDAAQEPFFLWIHNEEPHAPYTPPEKYFRRFYRNKKYPTIYTDSIKSKKQLKEILFSVSSGSDNYILNGCLQQISTEQLKQLKAQYLGNILYADEMFGVFMDRLRAGGYYDNSIIIVSADHGESMGAHSIFGHNTSYQDVIHVPLLIHLPGQEFSESIEYPVEMVDIYPSIMNLTGIDISGRIRGEDLFSVQRKKNTQFSAFAGSKVIIRDRKKYWQSSEGTTYYYDLVNDSNEEIIMTDGAFKAFSGLFKMFQPITDDSAIPGEEKEFPEEIKQRFREDGYWE